MRSREKKTSWRTLVNFIVCAVFVLFGTYVATQYYVKYDTKTLFAEAEVMKTRPNAPGSRTDLLEKHKHHCWLDDHPLGHVDAVVLRKKPYSPWIYAKKQRLIDRAIDQAVHKKDRGLDGVLMFCTDKIVKPRAKQVPEIKLSF